MKWKRLFGRQSYGWQGSNKIGLRICKYELDTNDYNTVQQQGIDCCNKLSGIKMGNFRTVA
jgi:hypothetical protein